MLTFEEALNYMKEGKEKEKLKKQKEFSRKLKEEEKEKKEFNKRLDNLIVEIHKRIEKESKKGQDQIIYELGFNIPLIGAKRLQIYFIEKGWKVNIKPYSDNFCRLSGYALLFRIF